MKSSDAKSAFVKRLLLTLTCVAGFVNVANAQREEENIRVDAELVNIDVVVTDRAGRRTGGLRKDDFEVEEGGVRQEITHFREAGRPLRLLLLFDTSFSMQEVLPAVRRQAGRVIGGMTAEDDLMIATFDCGVRWLTGWVPKERAAQIVDKIEPGPLVCGAPRRQPSTPPTVTTNDRNTYLYEAFREVLGKFKDRTRNVAVIVFSDGVDTAERFAGRGQRRTGFGKELARQAEESWVTVYPVHPKAEQAKVERVGAGWRLPSIGVIAKPKFVDPAYDFFSKITAATGGRLFEFTTEESLSASIREALTDLRSQYSLAYRPPRLAERRQFRRIKVRARRPGLVARARGGYRLP